MVIFWLQIYSYAIYNLCETNSKIFASRRGRFIKQLRNQSLPQLQASQRSAPTEIVSQIIFFANLSPIKCIFLYTFCSKLTN